MAESNGTAANGQAAPSPEKKALEEAKAIQDAKNALLTSQKAGIELERQLASAGVTPGSQSPLTNGTTGSDSGHLANLVAYHSLRRAAAKAGEQIVGALGDKKASASILIVDSLNLIEERALLQAVEAQVSSAAAVVKAQTKVNKALTDTAKASIQPPPVLVEGEEEGLIEKAAEEAAVQEAGLIGAAALALPTAAAVLTGVGNAAVAVNALSGLVGAAAGVAAWFRNEYTIAGQTVEMQQATARLLLAGALKGCRVYLSGFQPKADSELANNLAALVKEISELADCAGTMAGLASQLDAGTLKSDMDAMFTASKTLLETVNKQVDELLAAPAADAQSKMMRALMAEQLSGASAPYTHYLYVQVEAGGGQTITEKSLWHSGRMTYAGGGVLSYVLADSDGCIAAADALPMFSTLTMRNGKEATAVENVLLSDGKLEA